MTFAAAASIRVAGLLAALWLAVFGARAAAAPGGDETLERIARTGRIVLGVRDTIVPLDYLDASGEHIGYHMDVCRRVAEAVRLRLGLPALRVVAVQTTLATRLAMLGNRTVDIECAHNPVVDAGRAPALYSHATMVSEQRLMTTTEHPGLTLATLGGHGVALIAGSSAVPALRALAGRHGFQVRESFGRQAADAFALLEDGRADAAVFTTPYLLAYRALARRPERFVLADDVLQQEPLALMFRFEDEALRAIANDTLEAMMLNGEMAELYAQWFMRPVPSLPRPVGMPMPEILRDWFREPGRQTRGK